MMALLDGIREMFLGLARIGELCWKLITWLRVRAFSPVKMDKR
jgi:hypothetical protein